MKRNKLGFLYRHRKEDLIIMIKQKELDIIELQHQLGTMPLYKIDFIETLKKENKKLKEHVAEYECPKCKLTWDYCKCQ